MSDPEKKIKKAMGRPQDRKSVHIHYSLGDVGKPDDMEELSCDNHVPVHCFKPNDHCFVRRSSGAFTFAKVLSCEDKPNSFMKVQVDIAGSTKSLRMNQLYARALKSKEHQKPSSLRPQQNLTKSQRTLGEYILKTSKTRRPGRERLRLSRSASAIYGHQPPSPKKKSSLAASFRSCPADKKSRPTHSRGATSDTVYQHDLEADKRSQTRSCRYSIQSRLSKDESQDVSIEEDDLCGDDPSSPEILEFDYGSIMKPKTHDESGLGFYSGNTGSPCGSPRREHLIDNRSAKKVPSLDEFRDLKFNEDFLLSAFRTIASKTVVSRTA